MTVSETLIDNVYRKTSDRSCGLYASFFVCKKNIQDPKLGVRLISKVFSKHYCFFHNVDKSIYCKKNYRDCDILFMFVRLFVRLLVRLVTKEKGAGPAFREC